MTPWVSVPLNLNLTELRLPFSALKSSASRRRYLWTGNSFFALVQPPSSNGAYLFQIITSDADQGIKRAPSRFLVGEIPEIHTRRREMVGIFLERLGIHCMSLTVEPPDWPMVPGFRHPAPALRVPKAVLLDAGEVVPKARSVAKDAKGRAALHRHDQSHSCSIIQILPLASVPPSGSFPDLARFRGWFPEDIVPVSGKRIEHRQRVAIF